MLPDRAVDVAGLAEATPLRTAAHHLDAGPVVHDLHVGNGEAPVIHPIELQGGPLAHHLTRLVQGGDVHPGNPLHRPQEIRARSPRSLPLAHDAAQLQGGLLAVADEEGVDEVRQRLRRKGHGASGHDQGMPGIPLGRAHGDAGELQHIEDRREGQLVLEGESQDVEAGQGKAGLVTAQRDAVLPEERLGVHPGGVGPLCQDLRPGVQQLIEDLEAQVRHPDLIGIGKRQSHPDVDLRRVFHRRVPLPGDVSRGLADEGQDVFCDNALLRSQAPWHNSLLFGGHHSPRRRGLQPGSLRSAKEIRPRRIRLE